MKRSPTAEKRFWAKVDRSGGPDACWPWTAAKSDENYGQFQARGVYSGGAHRYAYQLVIGEIPTGLQLDHECHTRAVECPGGNTCAHRLCVNPRHLAPVTPGENFARSRSVIAERNRAKTHCPANHEYTEDNTYWVPDRATPHRRCKTCARLRKRALVAQPSRVEQRVARRG